MQHIDFMNKYNVFEYTNPQLIIDEKHNYVVTIKPGDVDMNILGINFAVTGDLCHLTLNEDFDPSAYSSIPYEPMAHNRYYNETSKIKIGTLSGVIRDGIKDGKVLFNRSTISEWNMKDYEIQGWTLNKYKKYAFIVGTNASTKPSFNFSFFWNEV